jgi:hypothetical protein
MLSRFRILACVAALAAGVGAAVALTFPHAASAWDWQHLPLHYSTSVVHYTDLGGNACEKISIDGNYMGDTCTDPAALQANVDAYVNATVCDRDPAAGQAAGLCLPTTTAATTTTADTTTAATTTTTAATTDATSTVTAPTTSTGPAVTTDTQTVTITTTVEDPALAARVTALEQNYATLAARVTAIQDANAAAWQTFHDKVAAGWNIPAAALAARSAGLNAVYELAI